MSDRGERLQRHSPSSISGRGEGRSHYSDRERARRRSPAPGTEKDTHPHGRSRRRSPDAGYEVSRRRDRNRDDNRERRRRRTSSQDSEDVRSRDDRRSRREDSRQLARRRSYSRSRSPPRRRDPSRERRRGGSRSPKRRRRSLERAQSPARGERQRGPLPSQQASFRGEAGEVDKTVEKQKPNFNATGLLAKEANTVAGTDLVLKYHEPAEARKPPSKQQWRMYVFKGKDLLDEMHLYTRSCWLMGREDKVVDYKIEHPSASKQHAVIQFRYITKTNEYGDREGKVKPYLIDLNSSNGTRLNGKRIEPSKYIELLDADVLGFGESEREYVMMLPPS